MAIDKETGLTDKQILFCQEYLIDLNGAGAAVRAGYSKAAAKEIASETLTKPNVKKYLNRLKRDRAERLQINADKVLAEISRLAFSDVRGIFKDGYKLTDISDLDDDIAAAIQSVKVTTRRDPESGFGDDAVYQDVLEYKLADKKGSLEMLAKHLGELTEHVHVEHSVSEEVDQLFNDMIGDDEADQSEG